VLNDYNGDGVPEIASGASLAEGGAGSLHIVFLSALPCDPGYYINADYLQPEVCLPCAPGTYQSLPAQPSCLACPAGYFQPLGQQINCLPCRSRSLLLMLLYYYGAFTVTVTFIVVTIIIIYSIGTLCLLEGQTHPEECPPGALCLQPMLPELAVLPNSLAFSNPQSVEVRESEIEGEEWSYRLSLTAAPKLNPYGESDPTGVVQVQVTMRIESTRFVLKSFVIL
jgi:hypothetical protein